MINIGFFPSECLNETKLKLINIINENKHGLEELLKEKNYSYMNFIRPLMDADYRITDFFTPVSHLQSVKNSEQSRDAFTSCIGMLTEYSTELSHDKRIYNAYRYIKENSYATLTVPQKKVIDDGIFRFELEGVALDEKSKARIKEININLSELADKFSQNVLDATNAYSILIDDEEILGEMPASDKDNAKTEGGWKFTLQMPSYVAFMTYVTDRDKREELYKAYSTRALENEELITTILMLRQEKAEILGFNNYAELRLKTMSAPSVDGVINFLEYLGKAGKPYALIEKDALGKYAYNDLKCNIESYDTAYYSEKLKKELYDYDEESLRPYFEQNRVVNGLFKLLEELFEISFVKKDVDLWDKKAFFYEISFKGKLSGGLYMDLESRADKRGGAWMNDWHSHFTDSQGVKHLPEAFVVCNFPQSKPGVLSLLRHDDVTTLFHEMGHAIHHLMSRVDELYVSGVNGIDWDTVEFPSQFLENFAYSEKVLNMIGKHYETGSSIPSELLKKVINARNYHAGLALVRQIEFALFDMRLHSLEQNAIDVQKVLDDVRRDIAVIIPPAYNKFQCSFSHIFAGGYAAGYYSYKWAEMLSSDAYCEFMKHGDICIELAHKYRDTVLALGASENMGAIYNKFLSREPKPDAILELSGLLKK